jgi:hypothetical protein
LSGSSLAGNVSFALGDKQSQHKILIVILFFEILTTQWESHYNMLLDSTFSVKALSEKDKYKFS